MAEFPEKRPRIVVIAGPTGAGKTAAVVALAQRCGGEVVSADAMAVYRKMDVGTAKPTPEERAAAPHHLVDVADPDEDYDAARFVREAGAVIRSLAAADTPVLIAGGTGLYIKALLHGLFTSTPSNPEVRERLRQEAAALGSPALHARLLLVDPAAAARLHPNDAFRIVRALEVFETTGRPMSVLQADHGFAENPYDALVFTLYREREDLYARIDRRVDAMFSMGLVEEVQGLLREGYSPALKSMGSLGYRHVCRHLAGEADFKETVEEMKRDTRRFAKRQLTWFRAVPGAAWTRAEEAESLFGPALAHLGREPAAYLPE